MAVKTMINSPTYGRFVFDAVFNTSHNANLMVTEHPVQSGGSVADHAFMEPDEVQLEIGMSDVATSVGTNHSVNAYTRLRAIMAAREPVTLVTRLKTYQNMLIVSLSAPDDYTTMYALRASVGFKQINIVSVSTVKVQQTVSASTTTSQTGNSGGGGGSSSGSTKKPTSSSSSKPPKKTSVLRRISNKKKAAVKTSTKVTTTKVAKKPTTTVLKKAASTASKFTKASKFRRAILK